MASPLSVKPSVFTGTFTSTTSALEKVLGSELDDNALKRMGSGTTEYVHTVASNVAAIADAHIKIIDAQIKQYSNLNSDEDQIENYNEGANEVRERFTEMKGLAETKAHQTKPGLGFGGFKTGFVAGLISNPYLVAGASSLATWVTPKLLNFAWSFIAYQDPSNQCPPGFQGVLINPAMNMTLNCTR